MTIDIVTLKAGKLKQLMQLQGGNEIRIRDVAYPSQKGKLALAIYVLKYIWALKKCDLVVNFYVSPSTAVLANIAHFFRKPFVAYWLGTDVYEFLHSRQFSTKAFDQNWAYAYSLKDELEEKIHTPVEKLTLYPVQIDYSLAQMPQTHSAMMYIPEGREDFYNYNLATELINEFPTIPFHIVANNKKELFPQPNAIMHGWLSAEEMNDLFDEISIVVRAPKHDGQSLSIMEGQLKGKYVFYNKPWPQTIQARTTDEFKEKYRTIISEKPQIQKEAHEFALKECDPVKGRERLLALIHKAMK